MIAASPAKAAAGAGDLDARERRRPRPARRALPGHVPERRPAMSDLYGRDILAWSEHQAALLRRRAAGQLVNEAELDWPNIAEEIESLGKNQSRELSSRIATILVHLMKLQASPASAPHAGCGVRSFHLDNAAGRRSASAHTLYFQTLAGDGGQTTIILRVLHHRMEPALHLGPELTQRDNAG